MNLPLVIVAAVARNNVIGGGNRLLWRLPGDLKRFRALTWGKPLIMGRKTFASIGRALPGRATIVLTRDKNFAAANVHVAHSIAQARSLAGALALAAAASEIILAGGAELYAAMLGEASRLHITQVDLAPSGDAMFPFIDPLAWRETARIAPERESGDEADYQCIIYERK